MAGRRLHHIAAAADGFSSQPVNAASGSWEFSLRPQNIGKGEEKFIPENIPDMEHHPRVCVAGDEMSVQHNGCRIEYINGSEGMRQKFIVECPPAGDGDLRVSLAVESVQLDDYTGGIATTGA